MNGRCNCMQFSSCGAKLPSAEVIMDRSFYCDVKLCTVKLVQWVNQSHRYLEYQKNCKNALKTQYNNLCC